VQAGVLERSSLPSALERASSPESVTRQDVEELLGPWGYERIQAGLPRLEEVWTGRLESLGHRLDDPDDPVMIRWRALCYDYPEPELDIDGSLYRVGHAGETGLLMLLSEQRRDHIRF
jgi:hypothetical protein